MPESQCHPEPVGQPRAGCSGSLWTVRAETSTGLQGLLGFRDRRPSVLAQGSSQRPFHSGRLAKPGPGVHLPLSLVLWSRHEAVA